MRLLLCLSALAFCMLLQLLPSASAADKVSAVINTHVTQSPPIAENFVGFSLEHDLATSWTGRGRVRGSFVTLMNQLKASQNQVAGAYIRVGGNSADYSWYNPDNLPFPQFPTGFQMTYNITDVDITSLRDGVSAYNGTFTVGLNFRRPENISWALAHATAVMNLAGDSPAFIGFEIGNEPDLYASNGNRKSNYTMLQFNSEWAAYASQLHSKLNLPSNFFIGPSLCCEENWKIGIPSFAQAFSSLLFLTSVHFYPYDACGNDHPTLLDLLKDSAATELATSLVNSSVGNVIDKVNQLGLDLALAEGNSVACSGAPNVSNVYGANLWVLDELFNSAQAGLSNWIFHAHDRNTSHYPPLIWLSDSDDTPTVQPEWYGLMLWAMATADKAVIVETSLAATTNPAIKVWSVISSDGVIRIIILHKDISAPSPAAVYLDLTPSMSSFPDAIGTYLLAASPYDTYGLSLAGMTWDGTKDGNPSGSPLFYDIPAENGIYTVIMNPGTIGLVIIDPSSEDGTSKGAINIDHLLKRAAN